MASPLRGVSSYDQTFLRSFARFCLVLGRWPSKKELMDRFGLSRSALNLVLRRLQGKGFSLSFPFCEELGCTVVCLRGRRVLVESLLTYRVLQEVLLDE